MTSVTSERPPIGEGMILFAKQGPSPNVMGDCPFTQKANLALRYQKASFDVYYIDLANKPDWFLDLNEAGSTPVFVDGSHAIGDSDEIIEHADKIGKQSGLKLNRESDPNWDDAFEAVSPLLGALVRLLKNKDNTKETELKDALTNALKNVDAFLGKIDSPYILGDSVSALDCNLAPKLNHIMVAAPHYKSFIFPTECVNVIQYMNNIRSTEEWKATVCTDDVIIWGWSKFFS